MVLELNARGLKVETQRPICVYFNNTLVGEYFADLLVNNLVICELKIARSIQEVHEVQLYNYLKATEIEVGLILNFGLKTEFKRRVFENSKKGNLDIYSKKINPENPVNPDNPRLN